MVPFPTITAHLPWNKATVVHSCKHKHTKTDPDKTGPVWALLFRKGSLFSEQGGNKQPSQLLPEASIRPQLLPCMHPGCWIWRSRSMGPNSAAQTHTTDVGSIFACPQLTEVMHGIQEASWIFPTDFSWIWIMACWAVLQWQPLEEQCQDSFQLRWWSLVYGLEGQAGSVLGA